MAELISNHLFALLTLLGAALVAFSTFKSSIKQNEAQEENKRLTSEIHTLQKSLAVSQDDIIKLQTHSLEKTNHQLKFMSGGDSVPYVDSSFYVGSLDYLSLSLSNSNKYPLYEVTVVIEDLKKMREMPGPIVYMDKVSTTFPSINMTPYSRKVFHHIKTPKDGVIDIIVRISARNVNLTQRIRYDNAHETGKGRMPVINTISFQGYRTIEFREFLNKLVPHDLDGKPMNQNVDIWQELEKLR